MAKNKSITGIRIVADHSDEVLEAMKTQAKRALEECGILAEGYAQENLTNKNAVRTGNLRNSITHKVVDDKCYVGTNVEYAPYVEFGTGAYAEEVGGRRTSWTTQDSKGGWHRTNGMPAKSYLRPAVADHADEYKRVIHDNLSH